MQSPEKILGLAKYSLGGFEEIKQLIVCPRPLPLFVVQEGPRGPMIETSKNQKSLNKTPNGIKGYFGFVEIQEVGR